MPGAFEARTPKEKSLAAYILCGLFIVIALFAVALSIYIAVNFHDAVPTMVQTPESAESCVVTLMDSLCQGDYDTASSCMLGNPDLGLDHDATDPLGVIFWEAYTQSLSYELDGILYATDNGLAQDIIFTYLDLSSATKNLQERSQALLEQRVVDASDTSQVYDENNEYREDFVMDVLYDAAQDALREDAQIATVQMTLNLTYRNGQWWVLAEKAFLNTVFSGILS